MYFFIKSWCLSALFLFVALPATASNADLKAVSEQQTWQLLIHSWKDKAQISDPSFLLSKDSFSALSELELTLAEYKENPQQTFCRFPARISYLAKQLNFDVPDNRFSQCPDLQSFLDHVPFESLSLIYASEVLSSATSMMGHIFIKASGLNSRQVQVEHSLAYYTEITTINPIKLVVESTITGMPGFFSVRPFARDVEQYILKEQRNLWQFNLAAPPERLSLLQLHIWELHQVNITYYFQSFNCATITLELLALLEPNMLQHRGLIVSPIDVVKAAISEHIVLNTSIDTAPHWLFHALSDSIGQNEAKSVDKLIFGEDLKTNKNNIRQLITLALNPLTKRYISAALNSADDNYALEPWFAELQAEENEPVFLDLSHYKHPAKTPQDSALGVGWKQQNGIDTILLHYLPTGHFLHADNRQYLSESELIIAQTTIALTPKTNNIKLEEFILYSVRSISPDHTAFPVISGEFYLGVRPGYAAFLENHTLFELSGGAGKSLRLHKDVLGYALGGAGLATDFSRSQAFIYAKTGVLINLIADTKLYLQYEANSGKTSATKAYRETSAVLSWFPEQNHSVSLKLNHVSNSENEYTQFGAEYYFYF